MVIHTHVVENRKTNRPATTWFQVSIIKSRIHEVVMFLFNKDLCTLKQIHGLFYLDKSAEALDSKP